MIFAASVGDGEGAAAAAARAKAGVVVAVQLPPVAEIMNEPYHEGTPEVANHYQVSMGGREEHSTPERGPRRPALAGWWRDCVWWLTSLR